MTSKPKEIVLAFLEEVRSGKNPQASAKYLAAEVIANQVISESDERIIRTPADYSEHVLEMKAEYGEFAFEIEELIAENDKVYARWTQMGNGIRSRTSCVYRVEQGLIVEYWIQIDRLGIELQSKAERNNLNHSDLGQSEDS